MKYLVGHETAVDSLVLLGVLDDDPVWDVGHSTTSVLAPGDRELLEVVAPLAVSSKLDLRIGITITMGVVVGTCY